MKAYIQYTLLSLFLSILMSFTVSADEVTDVVDDVAAKLVQQLPLDKKIALKSRSPEETGLPEEIFEAASKWCWDSFIYKFRFSDANSQSN